MNLNINPKVLHALTEFVQFGGFLGTMSSIAGTLNPIAGTVCAVVAGIATVVKTQIIGNVPATPPKP